MAIPQLGHDQALEEEFAVANDVAGDVGSGDD